MNSKVDVAATGPTRMDVVLVVYSDSLSPSELTLRLGLEPTKTTEKGPKVGKLSGALMQIPRHVWQLSSESSVSSMELATHFDWLLARLMPVRKELLALVESEDIECALSAIVWTSGSDAHIRIATEHMEGLVALGLDLRLEFSDYGEDS